MCPRDPPTPLLVFVSAHNTHDNPHTQGTTCPRCGAAPQRAFYAAQRHMAFPSLQQCSLAGKAAVRDPPSPHTRTPTSEVGTPGAVTGGGQDAITAPSSTPLPTGQSRRLEMTCAAPAAGPAVFPVSAVRLPPQQQHHHHLLHHHNSCSISPPRTTAALTLLRPQRAQLKSKHCPCVTRSRAPLPRRERLGTLRKSSIHPSMERKKK